MLQHFERRTTTIFVLAALFNVILPAVIHQSCSQDDDCAVHPNTFCSKGKECICLARYSRTYPPCNEGIELGDSCSRHENCEVNDNNSYCHQSICRCKPSFHREMLMDNATRCRPGPEFQDSCYIAEDCGGPNFTCAAGRCRCQAGFYKDYGTSECRQQRYLGQDCEKDIDCASVVNNSYCSHERCDCKNGYIRTNLDGIGEVCEIDRGGRGALKILFALMLPVVICAFVYLYRNRKVGQVNKNQSAEDDHAVSPPPPGFAPGIEIGIKAPSESTPLTPMSSDIIGAPADSGSLASDKSRQLPQCSTTIVQNKYLTGTHVVGENDRDQNNHWRTRV
ncbi:tenascin-like isoform X2 [Ornithodoros turicata]|uniref:tenascin-like isoform X2 n=1 Tax=Ornithodoros turicata TaxID=34597 RepID=UPI003138AB61